MNLINYHSEVLLGVVPAVSHNVMLSTLKHTTCELLQYQIEE